MFKNYFTWCFDKTWLNSKILTYLEIFFYFWTKISIGFVATFKLVFWYVEWLPPLPNYNYPRLPYSHILFPCLSLNFMMYSPVLWVFFPVSYYPVYIPCPADGYRAHMLLTALWLANIIGITDVLCSMHASQHDCVHITL